MSQLGLRRGGDGGADDGVGDGLVGCGVFQAPIDDEASVVSSGDKLKDCPFSFKLVKIIIHLEHGPASLFGNYPLFFV